MDIRMKQDMIVEGTKAAPPLAISAISLNSTLNTIVLVATLIYICLQGAHLVWKWHKGAKKRKNGESLE